jgi:hypothetical protein
VTEKSPAAAVRPGWLLAEGIAMSPSPPERDTQIDLIGVTCHSGPNKSLKADMLFRLQQAMVTFGHLAGFSGQPDIQYGMLREAGAVAASGVCAGVVMRVHAAPPGARSWR